jgi:hypothetical protein
MLAGKQLLTPIQRDFLTLFARLPDQEQFFLTGGTALAEFFLGHRISFDLDLFTAEEPLIVPFSRRLEDVCVQAGWEISITRRFFSYAEVLLMKEGEELRVDLALDSPFRFDQPLHSEYGVWVNDYKDLIVEKLLAYYGRAEPRDAVDLYMILKEEALADLSPLAAQKDPGFDIYWFAVALNKAQQFPDELERWPVKMVSPFDPVDLKRSFQEMAVEFMARVTRRDVDE